MENNIVFEEVMVNTDTQSNERFLGAGGSCGIVCGGGLCNGISIGLGCGGLGAGGVACGRGCITIDTGLTSGGVNCGGFCGMS